MRSALKKYAVAATYQLTVVIGILMLPIAVPLSKLGLQLRFDQALESLRRAYESAG